MTLLQAGTGIERRKQILIEQRARLMEQEERLRATIERLDYKIEHYEELFKRQ